MLVPCQFTPITSAMTQSFDPGLSLTMSRKFTSPDMRDNHKQTYLLEDYYIEKDRIQES